MEVVWRRYGGGMEAVWRRYGGGMEAVWRRYGGGMEAVWRQSGGGMEAVWRRYGGGMEAVWRRYGGDGTGGGMEAGRWTAGGMELDQRLVLRGNGGRAQVVCRWVGMNLEEPFLQSSVQDVAKWYSWICSLHPTALTELDCKE